ncbi:MAG: aminotransferase class I/II-fold pyridoxal phosphate-dependent enzyme [Bdellovibrionota bacterium]
MPRSPEEIRKEIHRLVAEYFSLGLSAPPAGRLPLVAPAYGPEEVNESIDSLLSTFVTMGEKVFEFERRFAKRVGAAEAVMVNSGSSANLLALAALANPAFEGPLKPGDEVIVPAVTWSTSVWPIVQVGAVPVLADVSLETLCLDAASIEKALSPKTKAVMPVHLLGNACDMQAVKEIAKKKGLFVIEDTCEALGTEQDGKVVGTFGDFGTYSFYFSHHITTIEGGMVVTSDPAKAELVRILRAHGWIRDAKGKKDLAGKNPEIDPRFLFVNLGFNLRPTDIQGAFGLHQLPRLDPFNDVRRRNAEVWLSRLAPWKKWLRTTRPERGTRHTWFAFPLLVEPKAPFTRKQLSEFLESKGIETRPVVAGNLARQPAFKHVQHRVAGDLPNSQAIMERGLFFGNHGILSPEDCERVAKTLEEFLSRHGSPGA